MKCVVCLKKASLMYHGFSLCVKCYKKSKWWLASEGKALTDLVFEYSGAKFKNKSTKKAD